MKKAFTLTLALLILVCSLCGCSALLGGNKYEKLSGTWRATIQDSPDEARRFLEAIDAYEEEIAAADLYSLKYVKTVTFTEGKTYYYTFDTPGTIACVREFLDGYFHDLYEVRTTLNNAYGMDFTDMSQYDFFAFYADLYGYTYYEELLDDLSANIYHYDELEADGNETGTYTIDGKHIMCTITGTTKAEGMEYKIDGNTLTLTYVNGTEVYTRVN